MVFLFLIENEAINGRSRRLLGDRHEKRGLLSVSGSRLAGISAWFFCDGTVISTKNSTTCFQ